jgi:hypothetical protein
MSAKSPGESVKTSVWGRDIDESMEEVLPYILKERSRIWGIQAEGHGAIRGRIGSSLFGYRDPEE